MLNHHPPPLRIGAGRTTPVSMADPYPTGDSSLLNTFAKQQKLLLSCPRPLSWQLRAEAQYLGQYRPLHVIMPKQPRPSTKGSPRFKAMGSDGFSDPPPMRCFEPAHLCMASIIQWSSTNGRRDCSWPAVISHCGHINAGRKLHSAGAPDSKFGVHGPNMAAGGIPFSTSQWPSGA